MTTQLHTPAPPRSAAPSSRKVVDGCNPPSPAAAAPGLALAPDIYQRAKDCVHCGLCLPTCPTYKLTLLETDSPRGRILLMKGMADRRTFPSPTVLQHLDLCLDCRACETACPSGVVYHELIEQTRIRLHPRRKISLVDRLVRLVFLHVFPYASRLKLLLLPVRLLQRARLWPALAAVADRLLPAQLAKMQRLLPPTGPVWEKSLARRYPPANGAAAKLTVGFFSGCIGSVLFQDVNRQSIALLQRAGCEVLVPSGQGCCGAIHHHNGDEFGARRLARSNIAAWEEIGSPLVVNSIGGCGAALREYGHLLRDDPHWADRAAAFSRKVRDITEILLELAGPRPTRPLDLTATYHDACHLRHAQGIYDPPRTILSWIPGLRLIPLAESDTCCGAAGTYNLTQPAMAQRLGERKIRNIQATGASVCVTGNVGCAMQIASEAARLGVPLRVVHPVTLLYEAL